MIDADSGRILFKKCRNRAYYGEYNQDHDLHSCIGTCRPDECVSLVPMRQPSPESDWGQWKDRNLELKDLLYSLMLESHNDTAVMLAEHLAGSVEQFADEMNQKARKLGLSYTHFVTPNGLDGADDGGSHRTAAKELARIMRYCVMESSKRKEFKMPGASSYQFSVWTTQTYSCINHNAFLTMMEGAIYQKPGLPGRQDIAMWGH